MTTRTGLRCIAAASLGVAGWCTTALGQADLNGDGHIEVAFGEPGTNELVMLNGATGAELWRKSGPDVFGWAASAHPDVNADGLADVIVTAPGFGAGAPGQVQALRGTDGQVLWSRQYGAISAKFGLGLGVIPDQDSDGVTDILVAMLSDDPSGETAVLLSGKTGAVLATAAGPVANLLETTRSGAFKFKTKDLDGSGAVEVADAVLVAQATGTNQPDADVDFSGGVDAEDTSKVLDEALAPPTAPLTPGQYILLTLEDPLRYNDGYRLVSLVTQPFQPTPPSTPCAEEHEAVQAPAPPPNPTLAVVGDGAGQPEGEKNLLLFLGPRPPQFPFRMELTGPPDPPAVLELSPFAPGEAVQDRLRRLLRAEIARYPSGTLNVASGVIIGSTLTSNGNRVGGLRVVGGLVFIAAGEQDTGAATDAHVIRAFHHEVSSLLLLDLRWGPKFDEARFRAALPDGFTYRDDRPRTAPDAPFGPADDSPSLELIDEGFLIPWAKWNMEQDFNSYAEVLMSKPGLLLRTFAPESRVGRKARVVRDFYMAIDPRFEAMLKPRGE